MNLRTVLYTATVLVSAASALVAPFAASAETRAEHAERMALIGQTPRFDAQPAATVSATEQPWAERQRLAGRTLRYDERAPAPVSAEVAPANRAQAFAAHEARANAAGRTVQWHEERAFDVAPRDLSATGRTGTTLR